MSEKVFQKLTGLINPSLFPQKIALANTPTPFRLLNNLSAQHGFANIWLKSDDQTGHTMSGNKVRKLEYLLHDAQSLNATVVITCGGIQSNHCRATAMACAQLGLKCHLILREGDNPGDAQEHDGNWFLDELCGAKITRVDRNRYFSDLDRIFEEIETKYTRDTEKPYSIPTGGSNALGLWGYVSAAQELVDDFNREGVVPDAVVCASGSGGTQGGLTLGFHLMGSSIPVYGFAVCDSQEYFREKILTDAQALQQSMAEGNGSVREHFTAHSLNINTIDKYIGPGYGKGYDEIYSCIQNVARAEGVIFDPVYTGKAFYGMLQEIEQGAFQGMKNIVFVHTGGTFGVFPHRHSFSFGASEKGAEEKN